MNHLDRSCSPLGLTAGRFLLCAALCVSSLPACAAPPQVALERQSIIGGVPDDLHTAVLAIRKRRLYCGTPPELVCSAVLIAPDAVLTAAHCVAGDDAGEIEVFGGPGGLASARAVVEVHVHPDFVPEVLDADVAVLRLATPLPFEPAVIGAGPRTDQSVTVVGYGISAFSSSETSGSERLMAEANVASIDSAVFRLSPVSGTPCLGDSGGAVLDSGGLLVGLIRGGSPDCAGEGSATRLDARASFVEASLSESPTPTPRPEAVACDATCDTDLDCPSGQRCLTTLEGARCGASFGPAAPGAPCALDEDCPGSACASFGLGVAAQCACLEPCRSAGRGGCSVTASGEPSSPGLIPFSWLCLAWVVYRLRRSALGRDWS